MYPIHAMKALYFGYEAAAGDARFLHEQGFTLVISSQAKVASHESLVKELLLSAEGGQ